MADNSLWIPLYIGDYLRDTRSLTLEEHGAYVLLIMEYWLKGPLPDDDFRMARILGCSVDAWRNAPSNAPSNAQASLKSTLAQFFGITCGFWHHKRIDAELERAAKASNASKSRKSKAEAAAKARWERERGCSGDAPSNASGNAPSNAPSTYNHSHSHNIGDDGSAREEIDARLVWDSVTLAAEAARRGGVAHVSPKAISRNVEVIAELQAEGVATETVLDTISAVVAETTETVSSLKYFAPAIRRAHALLENPHVDKPSNRRRKSGNDDESPFIRACLAELDGGGS